MLISVQTRRMDWAVRLSAEKLGIAKIRSSNW